MSAPSLKTFRVALLEWNSYSIQIEAISKEAAEARAREMWDCDGSEQFTIREGGVDGAAPMRVQIKDAPEPTQIALPMFVDIGQ